MKTPKKPLYAIKKNGIINTDTIADWPRAAIAMYLLHEMGERIFSTTTDHDIALRWAALADGAELIEVTVAEASPALDFNPTVVDFPTTPPKRRTPLEDAIKRWEDENPDGVEGGSGL